MAKEGKYATLRLPSGEMRMVPIVCRATVGVIGNGEGKTGIGRPGPCTPWGKPALGLKTRKKNKQSNKMIVRRRDGKALAK